MGDAAGRSWAFHSSRAARVAQLAPGLAGRGPPRGASFPGGSAVIFGRPLSPGAVARVVGAWRTVGPLYCTPVESGDRVKCGSLNAARWGWWGRALRRGRAAGHVGARRPEPPCVWRRSAADGFVSGGWTGTPPVGSSGRAVCPFLFLKEGLCARGPPAILEWWGEACGFRYGGSLARCVCSMRSCLTKNVLIRGVYFLGLFLTAGGGRNDNNGRVCVSLFIMCFPDWWLDQWMGIFISSWELGGEGRGLGAIP